MGFEFWPQRSAAKPIKSFSVRPVSDCPCKDGLSDCIQPLPAEILVFLFTGCQTAVPPRNTSPRQGLVVETRAKHLILTLNLRFGRPC
jgi:hypothetical protein